MSTTFAEHCISQKAFHTSQKSGTQPPQSWDDSDGTAGEQGPLMPLLFRALVSVQQQLIDGEHLPGRFCFGKRVGQDMQKHAECATNLMICDVDIPDPNVHGRPQIGSRGCRSC